MSTSNRPITSREYKLMLNTDRFADRRQGKETFWQLLTFLVESQGNDVHKKQKKEMRRQTWYLDTSGLELRKNGVTLRVREETDEDKPFKVTLKYRNPDRYVSASKNLSCTADVDDDDFKFEEDILPPFNSKFAHSVSFRTADLPKIASMSDAIDLFPGLEDLPIPTAAPVKIANGFKAQEVAMWIGKFRFDKMPLFRGAGDPDFIVKACLSFWYLIGDEDELPLTAEFSFDYDVLENRKKDRGELEQFQPEVVAGTNRFFRTVQKQRGWLNLSGTTKTAYAFDAL